MTKTKYYTGPKVSRKQKLRAEQQNAGVEYLFEWVSFGLLIFGIIGYFVWRSWG